MRIYTRTGDNGTTAIHGGSRVSKTDIRIEANGCLDALNVELGAARTLLDPADTLCGLLRDLQLRLMDVMSLTATPSELLDKNPNRLPEDAVEQIEAQIDGVNAATPPASHFILPGGSPLSVALHRARVAARTAERRLWALQAADPLHPLVLPWINRLSDLLFVLARQALLGAGLEEERWQAFAYKHRK